MTPNEAIKHVMAFRIYPTMQAKVSSMYRKKELKKQLSALEMAKEALEKQIPQKPLPEKRYYGVGKCPSCNAVFLDNTTNYCGSCGQALDWGEKTENGIVEEWETFDGEFIRLKRKK